MNLSEKKWTTALVWVLLAVTILSACSNAEAEAEPVEEAVYYSDQVSVLMYHDLTEGKTTKNALSVKDFKKQMELLKRNGFQVIGMKEYSEFILNQGPVPDNAVLITFDDGYESFYKLAYPVLKEYGYPATNFVIVKYIDERIGAPKITWDQMREMQKDGMTFYSHTYDSHVYVEENGQGGKKPALTARKYLIEEKRQETLEEARQRISEDLAKAEERLKDELGNADSILSFPYGAFNDTVLDVMQSLDIQLSFTVRKGINSRADANSYRINGANAKESPKTVIDHLKKLQDHS
ncbi:polysaccharide deacetylase family protein [Cohnella hongkongensis]|uniref:Polysaccharide deacetylase family protein n=1 Tax=Cohnella hongkongensis TaxID=178337 RepID=A0ABV9FBK1_9BACL